MAFTRREFLGMVSAAAALSTVTCSTEEPVDLGDDPLSVRKDFPVIKEGVYLNSPYITPSPQQVIDAGKAFMEAKASNPISLGNMLGETTAMRQKFARLVGASETEISVLDATSAGENIVANALDLKKGDNVVIDDLHYDTTYVLYSHLAKTKGIELRIVKNTDGVSSPGAFEKLVDAKTRLISVSWVSHHNGYRHDLAALADLAHAHNAYLYADAIQGLGMLALDAKAVGIDFFTAGTYKWLLGGYGVAPFYVREELMERITPDRLGALHVAKKMEDHQYELHSDGRKYIYATLAFEAVYQLSAGLDYLLNVGVENIERHTVALAQRLQTKLADQGYHVLTPSGNQSAIVSFEHGKNADQVRAAFDAANIKYTIRNNDEMVRIGPALFNNSEDIDQFLEVTGKLA